MGDAISALNLLNSVDAVVQDPLRFKARLEIEDQAFTSLTLRNKAFELWDIVGVASTGAKFASSAAVASTFFSSTSGGSWLLRGHFSRDTNWLDHRSQRRIGRRILWPNTLLQRHG